MRVGLGVAEEGVDSVDQQITDGVFHVFRFIVNFIPGQVQRLHQKLFDQPMSPQDAARQIPPFGGQHDTFIRRVGDQACFVERLEHAGDGTRRNIQRGRNLAGRCRRIRVTGTEFVNRFHVILNGQTCQRRILGVTELCEGSCEKPFSSPVLYGPACLEKGWVMMLNRRAADRCRRLDAVADELRVERMTQSCGATSWDFGVKSLGGLQAGLWLARSCLADLAEVAVVPDDPQLGLGLAVSVATDHPVSACMGSQYAGWKVATSDYFAMGSGPMRALANEEPLLQQLQISDVGDEAVGVLESASLPTDEVALMIAERCRVSPERLTLLVARTASLAGTVQIVARSVETALHKLFDLCFPLQQVVSGWGLAPLPPVAADDLTGIGRTNDAILYGGRVTLFMRSSDDELSEVVRRVPSGASPDAGRPFREIFAAAGGDFYQIDPHLFSPAVVQLVNLNSGRTFSAGQVRPDLVSRSFLE